MMLPSSRSPTPAGHSTPPVAFPPGRKGRLLLLLSLCLSLSLQAEPLLGQESGRWRLGVTLGGSALVGLSLEYRDGRAAAELGVGTWSLRDLSVTAVGKYYAGGGGFQPFSGLGFWGVTAFPAEPGERGGFALLLRAPLGVEYTPSRRHSTGLDVSLNRALVVRRSDPDDLTPPSRRIVPIPGLYYKFAPGR